MGQKDLAQKNLEAFADVSADMINALLYEGESFLRADEVFLSETETVYGLGGGKLKNQFQDIGILHVRDGAICAKYMMENQSGRDYKMPMREAGYLGAAYRKMYGEKQTYPVVGLVLYWGKGHWKQPHHLKELFKGQGKNPEKIMQYVNDLKLNLFEMAYLEEEVRKRFQSDMRVIVDYLAEQENYIPSKQKLQHPREVMRFLAALTGDVRYEEVISEIREEEENSMCKLIDKYEQRGLNRGRQEGLKLGEQIGMETGAAREIISFGTELNLSAEEIMERLKNRLKLDADKAQEYYNRFRFSV